MNLENNEEIKLAALTKYNYSQQIREDHKFAEHVELEELNYLEAKDKVSKSTKLDRSQIRLMAEILDVLADNETKFLMSSHKYICFYWSGVPLLKITILNREIAHNQQLHISLQHYESYKKELIADKKSNRILYGGLGVAIGLSVVSIGLTFLKK